MRRTPSATTVGIRDEEWQRRLPAAPFDLEYLVRVLEAAFGDGQVVRKILAGESAEQASGWDFGDP